MVWLRERIVRRAHYVDIRVPLCTTCATAHRRARIAGAGYGLAAGISIMIAAFVAMGLLSPEDTGALTALMVVAVAGIVAAPIVGVLRWRVEFPVAVRRYRRGEGSVEVRWTEPSIRNIAARESSLASDAANVADAPVVRRRSWRRGVAIGLISGFAFELAMAGVIDNIGSRAWTADWVTPVLAIGGILAAVIGFYAGSRRWHAVAPRLPRSRIA